LEDIIVDRRIISVVMKLGGWFVDWIDVAQDKNEWRAVVNR